MMPDLGFTDSGELAAVAHTLGIAHPTGYPLYTILAHVWSLLSPFSTVFDLNLFAVITTSLSISVFSLLLDEMLSFTNVEKERNGIISFSTALAFAFGSTIWSQATTLEVYLLVYQSNETWRDVQLFVDLGIYSWHIFHKSWHHYSACTGYDCRVFS
jgi:hypothetical protein